MTRRDASTPTPVGALLTAAFPPLADRLLALAIRRDWPSLVGPQISRRSQPGDLHGGTLTVVVDNSPWLQELTLREAELLSRLQGRCGVESIRALRFTLGAPPREPEAPDRRLPRRDDALTPPDPLTPEEEAWVAQAAGQIREPMLADTVRRLLVKDALFRRLTRGQP
ncbi:MAG: DUF721 domain-containing protein [Candidatus Rokubacteria bacterium]|nr:DUF721 domain-containing protein [Candidatus Rokubacteria bacterium]